MDHLELLRKHLEQVLEGKNPVPSQWGQPHLMTKALVDIKKAFDNPVNSFSERSIEKVLLAYRNSGQLHSFLDLKYACFGVSHSVPGSWRLLDDDRLFPILLQFVDATRTEPRKFRKCYQGLLSGYFNFPLFALQAAPRKNWIQLRQFLSDFLPVVRQALPQSGWVKTLNEHQNLLGEKPCDRYARELLAGNTGDLRAIFYEGLGISKESWIWQEVVFSQMTVACGCDDNRFKKELDRLLRIIDENSMILPGILTIRCVAVLTIRYAECRERPEHDGLRDAAVGKIGNPWVKKRDWDAHVKTKDGQPHDAARRMVNSWIKRRLIKDFFELLSDDGTADQRRLDYWLDFESTIEDMWFALGPYAREQGGNFKEFRRLANGRWLRLENPGSAKNNAFIMRMGEWFVVEFGAKGNACFIFSAENVPFDLTRNWVNGNDTGLKNKRCRERFIHRDSTALKWEKKLDSSIGPLIGSRPSRNRHIHKQAYQPGRDQAMISYIIDVLKLPIEDNRTKGGLLWVLLDNNKMDKCSSLVNFGFEYRQGKGWWKE
jgi:hypothetical protein